MYWHAEIRGAFEAPAAVRVLIYNAYSTPPPTPITTDPFTLLRPTNLAGELCRDHVPSPSLSHLSSSSSPSPFADDLSRDLDRIGTRVTIDATG